jgi:protein-tyrosine phosphatase
MIDLHSHILPMVDDGASSLQVALDMARIAVDDGIEVMACTPHFMPGIYDNTSEDIRQRVQALNQALSDNDIDLSLVSGSDAHIRPDFVDCLRNGEILTIHNSRYVLFEPPHNIMPQRMNDLLFNITMAGFVPILTHPERLKWIEQNYAVIKELAQAGVWMQITAGSLTGRFGQRPQYWAKRMLAEGLVSILSTDAHNTRSRPPLLAEGLDIAKAELGLDEAMHLVVSRPECVLNDMPAESAEPLSIKINPSSHGRSLLQRIVGVFS